MKWQNLRNNKCPRDGKDLTWDEHHQSFLECSKCGFKIRSSKAKTLIAEMNSKSQRQWQSIGDNSEEWNNFGHDVVDKESFL